MNRVYTIEEHQHRLAAWDAATAARASKLCRFTVQAGMEILEQCKFDAHFLVSDLPHPSEIDEAHKRWRRAVIREAQKQGLEFSHGVAAKLINCYLKARFVCGGYHEDERVQCLHPPIDALLLKALARQNVGGLKRQWNRFEQQRWSKYDSEVYQSVIDLIRQVLQPNEPLWKIERYWEGHR